MLPKGNKNIHLKKTNNRDYTLYAEQERTYKCLTCCKLSVHSLPSPGPRGAGSSPAVLGITRGIQKQTTEGKNTSFSVFRSGVSKLFHFRAQTVEIKVTTDMIRYRQLTKYSILEVACHHQLGALVFWYV